MERVRVIQWATGVVGAWSLRMIIDRPELELVGVWVSSPEKDGKDAGELCGRPTTGVTATSDKDAILALDADVVVHCALAVGPHGHLPFDDDVIRLLRSGKNVISTVSYFSPLMEGPERMAELEEACRAGNATLYGGGLDPGFVCDRVVSLLTGSLADVKRIKMIESIDVSNHPGAELLSEVGFGKRPEEMRLDSPGVEYYGMRLLPGAVAKLADMFGIALDGIEPRGDIVLAKEDRHVRMGTLPKGTMIGALQEFNGIRDGEPFITHQWVHYVGRDRRLGLGAAACARRATVLRADRDRRNPLTDCGHDVDRPAGRDVVLAPDRRGRGQRHSRRARRGAGIAARADLRRLATVALAERRQRLGRLARLRRNFRDNDRCDATSVLPF